MRRREFYAIWFLLHVPLMDAAGINGRHRKGKIGCDCHQAVVDLKCASGVTYQNGCFASCQGETDIADGACTGDSVIANLLKGTEDIDVGISAVQGLATAVSMETMQTYEEEGFVFVGTVARRGAPSGELKRETTAFEASKVGLSALRCTREGHLYKAKSNPSVVQNVRALRRGKRELKKVSSLNDSSLGRNNTGSVASASSKETASLRRKLTILNEDTRFEVTQTRAVPYKRIVQVDYDSRIGGCTGAVIGENHVLTAAHCVFEFGLGFLGAVQVSPGRRRSSKILNPFGTFIVKSVTVFEEYMNTGAPPLAFDLAVLELEPDSDGFGIGSRVGRFRFRAFRDTRCDIDPQSSTSGYPGDKALGSYWDSGTCENWEHECGTLRVFYSCDTFGGNSGSPLYTSENKLFGVHTDGTADEVNGLNSGVALSRCQVSSIKAWMAGETPKQERCGYF